MTTAPTTTLFEELKAAAHEEWEAYTRHPFVEQLGEGTLPLAAFQDYLVQDYLFLIQFARANALAAFKSRSLADIRASAGSLDAILTETGLHVRLAEEWGIDPATLEAAPEKQATVAYTRYVLDCGQVGDLLELNVALAPCAIGYAEIGSRLAPFLEGRPDHPYRHWITEYAGEGFQQAARAATSTIDRLAARSLTAERRAELVTVFRTATRLEADFWQQALDSLGDPGTSSTPSAPSAPSTPGTPSTPSAPSTPGS